MFHNQRALGLGNGTLYHGQPPTTPRSYAGEEGTKLMHMGGGGGLGGGGLGGGGLGGGLGGGGLGGGDGGGGGLGGGDGGGGGLGGGEKATPMSCNAQICRTDGAPSCCTST